MPLQPGDIQTNPQYGYTLPTDYQPHGVNPGGPSGSGGGFDFGSAGRYGLGGLLTLAGGIGGFASTGKQLSRADFDYDPSRTALAAYKKLTDINSPYYRTMLQFYQKSLAGSAPTTDTLFNLAKGSGLSNTGAANIAYNQSKAESGRIRDVAANQVQSSYLGAQSIAQGYLGMEADRAKAENQGYTNYLEKQNESRGSFFDQLLGTGESLLAKALV